MNRKAVFMDRDGTLNRDPGYPNSYRKIQVFPYSYSAVRNLNESGLMAVIVTNQSGVGRGLITEEELRTLHLEMQLDFSQHGARFDGIYYCPHHPSAALPQYKTECSCRKPMPGMAERAAVELSIDLTRSYMIGDKVEDILFGIRIKALPLLVLTGNGREAGIRLEKDFISPAAIVPTLEDAVDWILERESQVKR